MFKHELGWFVESRMTGFSGLLTSRSENLYGCNRYFIQPRVVKDMKLPDGYWVDEEDVKVIDEGTPKKPLKDTPPGGPISKTK